MTRLNESFKFERIKYIAGISFLLSLGCFSHAADSTQHVLTSRELAELMAQVEPWLDVQSAPSTNYSEAGWLRLISVARIIQKSDAHSVEQALHEYQVSYVAYLPSPPFMSNSQALERQKVQKEKSELELQNDSKLLLLMRVVFELPERKAWVQGVGFGAWFSPGATWISQGADYNPDGTLNFAWPITWNDGNPRMVGWRQGPGGISVKERYRAAEDYQYFRKKYSLRDLGQFRKITSRVLPGDGVLPPTVKEQPPAEMKKP
jgi:hypothetical protein